MGKSEIQEISITISGPAGAGKTTLYKKIEDLLDQLPGYYLKGANCSKEDPLLVFQNDFNRIILETKQTDKKEISHV